VSKAFLLGLGILFRIAFNIISSFLPWTFQLAGIVDCQENELGKLCSPVIYAFLLIEEVPVLLFLSVLVLLLAKFLPRLFVSEYWPVLFALGFALGNPLISIILGPVGYMNTFSEYWKIHTFYLTAHTFVFYVALIGVKHIRVKPARPR
tara:strand:- start:39098 stop:39544 length:447 start_codon:yes stop_codon:yes gene_type:complete